MDVTKTATAYALFYLDGEKLKVDYGPYPPGAAPSRADAGQSKDSHRRHLPDPTVVEASITVGGGGWGAENVPTAAGSRTEVSRTY